MILAHLHTYSTARSLRRTGAKIFKLYRKSKWAKVAFENIQKKKGVWKVFRKCYFQKFRIGWKAFQNSFSPIPKVIEKRFKTIYREIAKLIEKRLKTVFRKIANVYLYTEEKLLKDR